MNVYVSAWVVEFYFIVCLVCMGAGVVKLNKNEVVI